VTRSVLLVVLLAAAACLAVSSILGAAAPAPGWTTRCTVVSVYDGDTVVVEIRKTMRVRLLDCWAPEIRGGAEQSKAAGLASREHLKGLAEEKDALLFVPTPSDNVGDATSLGRVLGQIWVEGDSVSLAEHQVRAGHATKERP
jgi:endonuclease YncB( thermonuclease family)